MVIKVEGVWHQANAEETATICGLDPDGAEDYRPTLPDGATLHDGCARAGETVTEPTLTETKAEEAEEAEGHDGEKPGKVIQTFLVRVTLRLNPGDDDVERAEAAVPTNEQIAVSIVDSLYGDLDYFAFEAINVTAEKV